jgi:predicted acetyltransferase
MSSFVLMEIDIRTCKRGELPSFLRVLETAFSHGISDESIERLMKVMEPGRMHAAFEGDAMVGTAGVHPFTLTIPGGRVPAAGVTMVGVPPSHRRRGILTRMMRAQLDDVHERGESIAILWASEDIIYQRYGYGMSSLQAQIDLSRERSAFVRDDGPVGRMRLIDADEAVKILPSVYDRVAERTAGMFARTAEWWRNHRLPDPEENRRGGGPLWRAVLDIDGRPEAYALYRVFSNWESGVNTGYTHVEEAIGASPIATREIWRFLFGIDLMQSVRAWLLPADHPLLLSMIEPTRLRFSQVDTLWLRVVDVAEALTARSYEGSGSLVLSVTDGFCDWNAGTWRMEVDSGTAAVTRSTDEPDLRLDITDLGAVFLGAFSFTELMRANRVREETPGALARADALFHTSIAPWCPEIF